MLQETFMALMASYNASDALKGELWREIEKAYSGKGRHYHTLAHLQNLLAQLMEIKPFIKDWDALLFTLYYHDIVYSALKNNNEEESARLAAARMKAAGVPAGAVEKTMQQILATKQHLETADADTNLFTDADLSILGHSWDSYAAYARQVRDEYSIYPDIVYKPGRKKVLLHFLQMGSIFKTSHFRDKLEQQARQNLQREMEGL